MIMKAGQVVLDVSQKHISLEGQPTNQDKCHMSPYIYIHTTKHSQIFEQQFESI